MLELEGATDLKELSASVAAPGDDLEIRYVFFFGHPLFDKLLNVIVLKPDLLKLRSLFLG